MSYYGSYMPLSSSGGGSSGSWYEGLFDAVTGGISAVMTDRESERKNELLMAQFTANSANQYQQTLAPSPSSATGKPKSSIGLFAIGALLLILLMGRGRG